MSSVRGDGWLSEVMGMAAFRLDVNAEPDPVASLSRHAADQGRAFYFAKVDTTKTDLVRRLGTAGFFVADTNVVFELTPGHTRPAGEDFPGVVVGELDAPDEAAVLEIAATAFRYTRFHLDPFITDEVAGRIKREWCRAYARKTRGDRLFVAKLDGRPAGFLAALTTEAHGKSTAVIDLIAVGPDFHRKRVGTALTAAFVEHYGPRATSLLVGTQVANIPSVRLYERCGFSLHGSQYVLHLHIERGRPRV